MFCCARACFVCVFTINHWITSWRSEKSVKIVVNLARYIDEISQDSSEANRFWMWWIVASSWFGGFVAFWWRYLWRVQWMSIAPMLVMISHSARFYWEIPISKVSCLHFLLSISTKRCLLMHVNICCCCCQYCNDVIIVMTSLLW